jgi:hypothetical protein
VEGVEELFVTSSELSAAAAHVDKAYEGIMHRRLLLLRPGFLVLADVLTATDGKDHTFDWMYHNRGDDIQSAIAQQAADPPDGQGFEYIEDARSGTTDEIIRATVALDEDRVEITVNAEAGSEVLVGTGVGESILDRVPLIFVTRRGQKAQFAAVIEPVSGHNTPEVVGIEGIEVMDHETSGYLIRVRLQNGGEELYSYDPEGAIRNVVGIETGAELLCLNRESSGHYRIMAEYDRDE